MNKVTILSHSFTGKSLVLVYHDGTVTQTKIVEQSHVNWKSILAAYKKGQYQELVPLLDITGLINTKSRGKFVVKAGKVYYNGKPTSGYLFDQILFYLREFPQQYERIVRFAENLYQNPSEQAREELYKFLTNGNMPITEDGCFLGYKGVAEDYFSITAGKEIPIQGDTRKDGSGNYYIYNGVGETIELKRSDVDDASSRDCSNGLHVGSFNYAKDFAKGHLMIVKVNPRDAVSVPHSDAQKLRVCKYEVIAEEGKILSTKRDINYDKAAKVRYHNRRDKFGKFVSASTPKRDENGRFVSK